VVSIALRGGGGGETGRRRAIELGPGPQGRPLLRYRREEENRVQVPSPRWQQISEITVPEGPPPVHPPTPTENLSPS
jgi:hypothetical protein